MKFKLLKLGYTPTPTKISVTQRILHDGEVNRARYMPQNPNIIATKTTLGPTYIFDRTKHANEPNESLGCIPELKLLGQEKEGYLSIYICMREDVF